VSDYVTYVPEVDETALKTPEDIMRNHLFQIYQSLLFVQTLPAVDQQQLTAKHLNFTRKTEHTKLVVFDLDETLVHCSDNSNAQGPDIRLPITLPTGEDIIAGVNIRPFAKECLMSASTNFEVAIFTASHQCYADAVLDHLDPTQSMISHRFYRDNCVFIEGTYIKDLRVFGSTCDMADIVIIDNSVYSFAYQLDNGIPIISWYDNQEDQELKNLMEYL
jgi:CTD small phosphatase-like protein 2